MSIDTAGLWLLFDVLLLGTLLGLALAAVLSPEPRRAVVLFIAFGLWLALVWARLRAPDVALAEAAIGAGIGGALMLSAARRAGRRGPRVGAATAVAPTPAPMPAPPPTPAVPVRTAAGPDPARARARAARAGRQARWLAGLREQLGRDPSER